MKFIKKRRSENILKISAYNPNTFNAFDGLIAFLVAIIGFYALGYAVRPLASFLYKTLKWDYFLVQSINLIISQAFIILVAFLFFKIKKVTPFSAQGYTTKINALDASFSIMLCLGIGLCFYSLHDNFHNLMTDIFGDLGLGYPDGVIEKSNLIFITIYSFILTPVLPAVCEELLFRGVIMRGLNEKGEVFGIVFSSVLFALMHGSVGMILLQFLLGLSISIISHVMKNHIYGVIMHFANNLFLGIVLSLSLIFVDEFAKFGSLVGAFTSIFGIVFLLVAGYYFLNKHLANYKKKILNVEPKHSPFEKTLTIKFKSEDGFYEKYYDQSDDFERQTNTPFLYNGKFIKYNKKSNLIVVGILSGISLILAIINLFV